MRAVRNTQKDSRRAPSNSIFLNGSRGNSRRALAPSSTTLHRFYNLTGNTAPSHNFIPQFHQGDVLHLNIGGTRFILSKSCVAKYPDTVLGNLVIEQAVAKQQSRRQSLIEQQPSDTEPSARSDTAQNLITNSQNAEDGDNNMVKHRLPNSGRDSNDSNKAGDKNNSRNTSFKTESNNSSFEGPHAGQSEPSASNTLLPRAPSSPSVTQKPGQFPRGGWDHIEPCEEDPSAQTYFYNRSPILFAAIADFYRTGVIHNNANACVDALQAELAFWGVYPRYGNDCCLDCLEGLLVRYKDWQRILEVNPGVPGLGSVTRDGSIESAEGSSLKDLTKASGGDCSGWRVFYCCLGRYRTTSMCQRYEAFRSSIWSIVEGGAQAKSTLLFNVISVFFIFLNACVMVIGSLPDSQWSNCDTTYLNTTQSGITETTPNLISATRLPINVSSPPDTLTRLRYYRSRNNYPLNVSNNASNTQVSNISNNDFHNFSIGNLTASPVADNCNHSTLVVTILWFADLLCTIWFTFEYLIRLWAAPDRWEYFRQPLAIIDLLAVMPFYIELAVLYFNDEALVAHRLRVSLQVLRILRVSRAFRVLRILKLMRYESNLQLFATCLRESMAELLLLSSYLFMATLLFGTLLYQAEQDAVNTQYNTIPNAAWWSITTYFAYSEAPPETPLGKLIAAVGAIWGVVLLAFPISIIVDKFSRLFDESRREKQRKRQQEMRQKKLSILNAAMANAVNIHRAGTGPLKLRRSSRRRSSTYSNNDNNNDNSKGSKDDGNNQSNNSNKNNSDNNNITTISDDRPNSNTTDSGQQDVEIVETHQNIPSTTRNIKKNSTTNTKNLDLEYNKISSLNNRGGLRHRSRRHRLLGKHFRAPQLKNTPRIYIDADRNGALHNSAHSIEALPDYIPAIAHSIGDLPTVGQEEPESCSTTGSYQGFEHYQGNKKVAPARLRRYITRSLKRMKQRYSTIDSHQYRSNSNSNNDICSITYYDAGTDQIKNSNNDNKNTNTGNNQNSNPDKDNEIADCSIEIENNENKTLYKIHNPNSNDISDINQRHGCNKINDQNISSHLSVEYDHNRAKKTRSGPGSTNMARSIAMSHILDKCLDQPSVHQIPSLTSNPKQRVPHLQYPKPLPKDFVVSPKQVVAEVTNNDVSPKKLQRQSNNHSDTVRTDSHTDNVPHHETNLLLISDTDDASTSPSFKLNDSGFREDFSNDSSSEFPFSQRSVSFQLENLPDIDELSTDESE